MDQSEHARIRNLLTDRCPGHAHRPVAQRPTRRACTPHHTPDRPTPGAAGRPRPAGPNRHPSYPTTCIPPAPPLSGTCSDASARRFVVLHPDPHNFDGNGDGVGCEG